MIKNICVYGVGGVGGYFGVKMINADLEKAYNISFIARGTHLDVIKESGLTLKAEDEIMVEKPYIVTNDVNDIESVDMFIVCVKAYDLTKVLEVIKDKVKDDTIIIPLLNGVDIYERIRKVIKNGIVMPACVYVGTHVERPGVISQKGGEAKIIFGKDPQRTNCEVDLVKKVFDDLKVNYLYKENPYAEIWTKYMCVGAYGIVTAATGKTMGMVYEDKKLKNDVFEIMQEIKSIANKKGIYLEDNVVEDSLNKAAAFPYETKTSFQRDVENPSKNNEKEIFGQTIIKLGKELGVDTKTTEMYYL